MAENSSIEWTTNTFNPWVGCMKVSPGCKHCYASVNTFTRAQRSQGRELWGPASTTDRHVTSDAKWREPVKWNARAEATGIRERVFCASMADVFEDHPSLPPVRERLWPLIEATPWLDWQLLTKRPENVMEMVPFDWHPLNGGFPRNVWIGTSVEDQQRADERIPELLAIPARVRFLSCEPLLGPVDLREWVPCQHLSTSGGVCDECGQPPERIASALHWIIVGGESGAGARPMDLAWARAIVDQCQRAGVPVFVKQLGARPHNNGATLNRRHAPEYVAIQPVRLRDRKGGNMAEWSPDLRVREMPS